MANVLNPFQKITLFKSSSKGQFNYCPLLWMFCLRSSNNLINEIHERALNLTPDINDIFLNELLSINNEVSIHNKNTKTLLIEVYKNLNGLSPPIMLDLFTRRENIYNLRNFWEFYCEKKEKTIRCGTETVTYKAAQLWELLPYNIKNSPTLIEFKNRIKTWSPDNFPLLLLM